MFARVVCNGPRPNATTGKTEVSLRRARPGSSLHTRAVITKIPLTRDFLDKFGGKGRVAASSFTPLTTIWSGFTIVSPAAIPVTVTALQGLSRGDSILQPCLAQRRIISSAQYDTAPFEARRSADFPAAAAHFHRIRTVVEAETPEVVDAFVCREPAPTKAITLVESDRRLAFWPRLWLLCYGLTGNSKNTYQKQPCTMCCRRTHTNSPSLRSIAAMQAAYLNAVVIIWRERCAIPEGVGQLPKLSVAATQNAAHQRSRHVLAVSVQILHP